jgi:glutamate-5-semialdehyde dehydrogenase
MLRARAKGQTKMNDLTQTPEMLIATMGARARAAAAVLASASDAQKIDALRRAAQSLRDQAPQIIAANARDMENAAANGLSPAMLDRLRLDEDRVLATAAGVDQVATLVNPLGSVIDKQVRPNGMESQCDRRCGRALPARWQRRDLARRQ